MKKDKGQHYRTFETAATRSLDDDKLDFEGFLSPYVLTRYAEYMHQNRHMADGSLRDSDNWQKGIPRKSYMQSAWRHFMDVWSIHRGRPAREDLEQAICGCLFNLMGYLHEIVKERERGQKQS